MAALLLAPKLIAIEFFNRVLVAGVSARMLPFVLAQDLLLCLVLFVLLKRLARFDRWFGLPAGVVTSGALYLLLMHDLRVRELWLRPLDLELATYGLTNFRALESGLELFYKFEAGLGMTLRRLLALGGVAFAALWVIAFWCSWRGPWPGGRRVATRRELLGWASLSAVVVGLCVSGSPPRYRLDENVVVRALALPFRAPALSDAEQLRLAEQFEQQPAQLADRLAPPRRMLEGVTAFTNVVVVIYESVRWASLDLDSSATVAPTLAMLAREGMLAKGHVSIPHSSKAYFAVLTGRHPYPGIEIREATVDYHPSIFYDLTSQYGLRTYAFSSLFLAFENMGGLLKAMGIERRFEARDLARIHDLTPAEVSSFGTDDRLLYELAVGELARGGPPFAAVFFPTAAHYPYHCGAEPDVPAIARYRACIARSDVLLAELLGSLRGSGLLEDTLVVVVGDHGESFGEHGLFVHNSSLFEEETTVPVLFWADDGRLRTSRVGKARQIDVAPTIADFMGLDRSEVPVQGVSLLRSIAPEPVFMSTFFDDLALALIEGSDKYIYDPSIDRLTHYDLSADIDETDGVVVVGAPRERIVSRLRAFQAFQRSVF